MPGEPVEKIAARGKWIIPGFVQAHLHLCQTLLRNGPAGLELLPWLERHVWPGEAAHDDETIAVSARLKGTPSSKEEIGEKLKAYSSKRWASQPAAPSAGCIFKNPEKIPAGRLVDELGLKGIRVGGAMASTEHGNFIVNDGGATAEDVLQLIALIQSRARESRQIDLSTEVIVLGEEN